jgi:hypothetical protein
MDMGQTCGSVDRTAAFKPPEAPKNSERLRGGTGPAAASSSDLPVATRATGDRLSGLAGVLHGEANCSSFEQLVGRGPPSLPSAACTRQTDRHDTVWFGLVFFGLQR